MDKWIERIFRFVEMIGITALLKAVIVPAYPVSGAMVVALLTAGAAAYLINPIYDWTLGAMTTDVKTLKPMIVAAIVTGVLFVIVQVVWLHPLIARTSDLITTTISTPANSKK